MEGQRVCTHWEAGRPSINSRFPGSVGGVGGSRSVTAAFAPRTPWCPVTPTFHSAVKSDGTKERWSFLFHFLPPPNHQTSLQCSQLWTPDTLPCYRACTAAILGFCCARNGALKYGSDPRSRYRDSEISSDPPSEIWVWWRDLIFLFSSTYVRRWEVVCSVLVTSSWEDMGDTARPGQVIISVKKRNHLLNVTLLPAPIQMFLITVIII